MGRDLEQIVGLLQRLDAQQTAIAAQLDILLGQRAARCAPADAKRLARILPVLGATFGSALVTTSEIFQSPSPGLRLVLDGVSRRALGKLLARGAGHPIDGYVVTQVGIEHSAAVWSVAKVVWGVCDPVETPQPSSHLRRASVG